MRQGRSLAHGHTNPEPGFRHNGCNRFGDLLVGTVNIQRHVKAIGKARLGQKRLGLFNVVLVGRQVFVLAESIGTENAVGQRRVAVQDLVNHQFAIKRMGQCVAHPDVGKWSGLVVQRDIAGARAVHRHHLGIRICFDLSDIVRRQLVDDVHLTGQQGGDARGIFRDDLKDHAIHAGLADRRDICRTAIVAIIALHDDALALTPLNQLEWARTVDVICHGGIADGFDMGLRDHFLKWQHRRKDRPGRFKLDAEDQIVDDFDIGDPAPKGSGAGSSDRPWRSLLSGDQSRT